MKVKIIFFLLFCFGCKNKNEIITDKLSGQWAIDSISYNGINYKNDLRINFIVFDQENKISLPASDYFEKDYDAKWFLKHDNEKNILLINCKDEVFNGKYNLIFIKNQEKKLLGIELKSDSTFVRAYKFFQNFKRDGIDW